MKIQGSKPQLYRQKFPSLAIMHIVGNQALTIIQIDTDRWVLSASVEGMARTSAVRGVMREMEQVLLASEAAGTSDRDETEGQIAMSSSACMGRRCSMERSASPSLPPMYADAT